MTGVIMAMCMRYPKGVTWKNATDVGYGLWKFPSWLEVSFTCLRDHIHDCLYYFFVSTLFKWPCLPPVATTQHARLWLLLQCPCHRFGSLLGSIVGIQSNLPCDCTHQNGVLSNATTSNFYSYDGYVIDITGLVYVETVFALEPSDAVVGGAVTWLAWYNKCRWRRITVQVRCFPKYSYPPQRIWQHAFPALCRFVFLSNESR